MNPRYLFVWILLTLLFPFGPQAGAADYATQKAEAERYFERQSYAKSHAVYQKINVKGLAEDQKRWVQFRLADTLWRSQSATRQHDSSKLDQARKQLESMIRDVTRKEDQDRVWVEVKESLGDYWWNRQRSKNWSGASQHYLQALDWWAGSKDITLARKRYLDIVWRVARPKWHEPYYYYGYYGNTLPINILENALKVAKDPDDRAHAHYLIAMSLRHQGAGRHERVAQSFEEARKPGKRTEWYDDALFYHAEWLSQYGTVIKRENGQRTTQPDYVQAVKLYRQLIREFSKGETRFYDQAKANIENITRPMLGVSVSNFFTKGSYIRYRFNWRNMENVEFTLYRLDMTEDIPTDRGRRNDYLQSINRHSLEKVKSWTFDTEDQGSHQPGNESTYLKDKLPLGAYLLHASGNGQNARDLVLVTDAALLLKVANQQALVYFADLVDGSPIPKARVKLLANYYHRNKWHWRDYEAKTDSEGLARFRFDPRYSRVRLIALARKDDRQAFALSHNYYRRSRDRDSWKVYTVTDRPAYRPEEKAHWKFTARTYDGSVYSTPANETVHYEIRDSRGNVVSEDNAKLNEFGSAWGSLELTKKMPLGVFQIQFWTKNKKRHIGQASLFRLEEYKLPEFKVSVATPEENGKKKTYVLGDSVEVDIHADYYFGGPVSNATVELMVHQNPYHHYWYPQPEFPWFYEDIMPRRPSYYGNGPMIHRVVLKTDAEGKATFKFDTPVGQAQDLEYTIEARVTDASRREIVASDKVRVSRYPYYVHLNPEHRLIRPGSKATINIKALDANEQGARMKGEVRVTRETWDEIWIDPQGREFKGQELDRQRRLFPHFPPPPSPGGEGWKFKFRGYEHEEILTRSVKTGEDGSAELTFTPGREGYYQIAWTGEESETDPVTGFTHVWVADDTTAHLGYHQGGLEIIVDKDTFTLGRKAPVMISAPTSDRYVLFSVEADDLYNVRLLHLTGSVKLVELDIQEKHVPNVFLNAVMVSDRTVYEDTKQVVVPPIRNFLDVDVTLNRDQYQPREKGVLEVTTLDNEGKPVSAEVSVGLVDESVYAIQEDYSPDPRQFFFGSKRGRRVQTHHTHQIKPFARLIEDEDLDFLERDVPGRSYGAEKRKRVGAKRQALRSNGFAGGLADVASEEMSMSSMSAPGMAMKEGAPMPAAPAPMAKAMPMGQDAKNNSGVTVQVRSDFRSTVLWDPHVVTGANGKAKVPVTFPDSLTQWRGTVRVASKVNQFGTGTTNARTRMPLIVRLQAPRFFVVGDSVTLSAVINNNTGEELTVTPQLDATGLTLDGPLKEGKLLSGAKHPTVSIPANGEVRADWQVHVETSGPVRLRVTAQSKDYGDAMEKEFVAHAHGIDKFVARSGKVRSDTATLDIEIPGARDRKSTEFTVRVTPSLAVTMLDSLPYLIDYPYGCTEQTMSRFLPAVITANTLKKLGLSPEKVMGHVFGGIETAFADKTHAKGKKNLDELDAMVDKGLERLYDFQHSDGGWGWWKKGESDHFMTAYVLWGMTLAARAGVDVDSAVMSRAGEFLTREIVEEELNFDNQAWMLHALAVAQGGERNTMHKYQRKAFDNLWEHRSELNGYTRSLLALSAWYYGDKERARTLIENLENGVKRDDAPDTSMVQRGGSAHQSAVQGTAHWGADGLYWRWSQGPVETTAFALKALVTIDPKNALIEPVTNWLIKNRRGAQWSNTRDTAIVVLAMNDYLVASGELSASMEYEVFVNDRSLGKRSVSDPFEDPGTFVIEDSLIRDGVNRVKIVRTRGEGPLYFSAHARFFSLEEPIRSAGNEIFMRRQYYELKGQPTLLKGYVYEKVPFGDEATLTSGERVEVVLTVEAKNDYEYLVFEDLKPAGFEAVQLKSGQPLYIRELKSSAVRDRFSKTLKEGQKRRSAARAENVDYTGRQRWVHQELRDRKVALFIDKLPEGVWEIRYPLRAEAPGRFHALPVMGHAMYVPEIRGNGEEIRVSVKDY